MVFAQILIFAWIDPEMLREFNENGVAVVRGVFRQGELDPPSNDVEELIKHLPPKDETIPDKYDDAFANDAIRGPAPRHGGGMLTFHSWRNHSGLRDLVFRSKVAELAARMLGSTAVNFFYDLLFVKEAYYAKTTPWHQDQAYYALSGKQICTTWVPFDDVGHNVSLRFVLGSHRWGTGRDWLPTRFFNGTDNYQGFTGDLKPLPDIDALTTTDADGSQWFEHKGLKHRIATFDVRKGDVLIFHSATLHSAPAHASPHRRRAIALRWLGDDITWIQKDPTHSIPNTPSPKEAPKTLHNGDPIRNEPQTFLLGWRMPASELDPRLEPEGMRGESGRGWPKSGKQAVGRVARRRERLKVA